ncbi:8666_t:CDS:2 [Funneliformis caledonium]|uniref:8666_t:CDS:1 n=1 Tax=Funneliformis caledonium TaxID=1117310 RepID=A0A9N8ZNQ5_9GLOM|nr:8666_t:CDS:2 [Funneliformis caledonium]
MNCSFDAWRKLGLLVSSDELLVRRLVQAGTARLKDRLQIVFCQVKKMKNFATASGGATHIVESSNIAFRRHQEITSTEGTLS